MMSSSSSSLPRVVPAHLSYLAIYNPSLGPTDETVHEQIVFYYSKKLETERERRRRDKDTGTGQHEEPRDDEPQEQSSKDDREEEGHERLRQVGLAQGMVDFVK